MSLILDALRRRSRSRRQGGHEYRTARTDAVLEMLGYPRQRANAPSGRTLLLYAAAAAAVGFLGLILLVSYYTPAQKPEPGGQPAARRPLDPPAVAAPPSQLSTRLDASKGQSPASGSRLQGSSSSPRLEPGANARSQADASAPGSGSRASGNSHAAVSAGGAGLQASGTSLSPEPEARSRSLTDAAVPGSGSQASGNSRSRVTAGVGLPPAGTSRSLESETRSPGVPAQSDRFALAMYFQRIGDFENALAQYKRLLSENDASPELHNNVGLLYQEHGQGEDAIQQFRRAIEIDPTYTKAHNNLGVALMRSGHSAQAAAEFRVALAANPRNVESIVNLALVEKTSGRSDQARELLQRAVALDPTKAGSHYNLAVVADESGDTALAIEHYQVFLRFGTIEYGDLASQVRARLAALGAS